MNTTTQNPAVAALLADVEALVLRRLSELLPAAAPLPTGEPRAARAARWLAVYDALPAGRGQLIRAARQIALSEGVGVEVARRAICEAKAGRSPRYGRARPALDTCWH